MLGAAPFAMGPAAGNLFGSCWKEVLIRPVHRHATNRTLLCLSLTISARLSRT